MKSFWHFNFYFKKSPLNWNCYFLSACVSVWISFIKKSPSPVCLLTWREEPTWNNEQFLNTLLHKKCCLLFADTLCVFSVQNLDSKLCLKINTQLPLSLLLLPQSSQKPAPSPLPEMSLLLICWTYSLDPMLRSLPGCPISVPVLLSLLCFSVLYSI